MSTYDVRGTRISRKGESGVSNTAIAQYAEIMKELKLRTKVISALSSGQAHAVFTPSTIESVGLQFRKCFELIAFASLAANQMEYSAAYSNFSKHWEAAKLVKNLKRINPNFYPKPVKEAPTTQFGVTNALVAREGDFLTEAELIEAHGRCGGLMHSANPFAKKFDYDSYIPIFQTWYTKMVNLLNNHEVRLLNDKGFYLVHMQEHGHDEVRWYRFERHPEQTSKYKM